MLNSDKAQQSCNSKEDAEELLPICGLLDGCLENLRLHAIEHLEDVADLDELLVLYKNHAGLTKSNLDYLIAAFDFLCPRMKGALLYVRAVAKGKQAKHDTQHTVPLTSAPARLFGAHLPGKSMALTA